MHDPHTRSVLLFETDEPALHAALESLDALGYPVATTRSAIELLRISDEQEFDLILVPCPSEGIALESLVRELRRRRPRAAIVLMAGSDRIHEALALTERGADDFVMRPPQTLELRLRLARLLNGGPDRGSEEPRELDDDPPALPSRGPGGESGAEAGVHRDGTHAPIALSPGMSAVMARIDRIAPMRSTVLLLGESGAGKELAAREIHLRSTRSGHPFVALNCAAIPENLIESELFGHEKGAFTGAFARTAGKFEIAHLGTLFLDEIGEMRRETQAKLLRVLEEREFMRIGGHQNVRVDVRVVAATNANLERLVREGRFRSDLYFRLKVITIPVPPLRERREDLPGLVRLFLDEICRVNGLAPRRLSSQALAGLLRHTWPGNVRELKNVLESVVVGTSSRTIGLEELPLAFRDGRQRAASPALAAEGPTLQEMERELIRQTLERTAGNRTHSARILDIGVRTLQRKIRLYGL
jgi:two-component system response regulator HydG